MGALPMALLEEPMVEGRQGVAMGNQGATMEAQGVVLGVVAWVGHLCSSRCRGTSSKGLMVDHKGVEACMVGAEGEVRVHNTTWALVQWLVMRQRPVSFPSAR
jgi:hypothetical protein